MKNYSLLLLAVIPLLLSFSADSRRSTLSLHDMERQMISKENQIWSKHDYIKEYCSGVVKHKLQGHDFVDCLTKTHAIEYSHSDRWYYALSSSLFYSAETNKKAGIVLIVDPKSKGEYLKRVYKTIDFHKLDIDVWVVEKRN